MLLLTLLLVLQITLTQAGSLDGPGGSIWAKACRDRGGIKPRIDGRCGENYDLVRKCCIPKDGPACGPGREIGESGKCEMCKPDTFNSKGKGDCLYCTNCTLMKRYTLEQCTPPNNTLCGGCWEGYMRGINVDSVHYECVKQLPRPPVVPSTTAEVIHGEKTRKRGKNSKRSGQQNDGTLTVVLIIIGILGFVALLFAIASGVWYMRSKCPKPRAEKTPGGHSILEESSGGSGSCELTPDTNADNQGRVSVASRRRSSQRIAASDGRSQGSPTSLKQVVTGDGSQNESLLPHSSQASLDSDLVDGRSPGSPTNVKQVATGDGSQNESLLPHSTQASPDNDPEPAPFLNNVQAESMEHYVHV